MQGGLMMNAHVTAVLLLSWMIGSTIAGLLVWCKAKRPLVYCVFIGVGLLTGVAYNWAYGMAGSAVGWIILGLCSLLWLQGAWVVTSLIPRWLAAGKVQPPAKEKGATEARCRQVPTH
jgi:hypothetical protein